MNIWIYHHGGDPYPRGGAIHVRANEEKVLFITSNSERSPNQINPLELVDSIKITVIGGGELKKDMMDLGNWGGDITTSIASSRRYHHKYTFTVTDADIE